MMIRPWHVNLAGKPLFDQGMISEVDDGGLYPSVHQSCPEPWCNLIMSALMFHQCSSSWDLKGLFGYGWIYSQLGPGTPGHVPMMSCQVACVKSDR